MGKRISHNGVGSIYKLMFTGESTTKTEEWMLTSFSGPVNVPEMWRAYFQRVSLIPGEYGQTMEAYRHKGRWVYGSSAEILRSM